MDTVPDNKLGRDDKDRLQTLAKDLAAVVAELRRFENSIVLEEETLP